MTSKINTTEWFCIYCGGDKDQCMRWKPDCDECPPFREQDDDEDESDAKLYALEDEQVKMIRG